MSICTKSAQQLSIHPSGCKEPRTEAQQDGSLCRQGRQSCACTHGGQCQPSTTPAADSPAPHQPFSSPGTPDLQPDSKHYLLRSWPETRAKGKVGQNFWPGSLSHCSLRPPLHHPGTSMSLGFAPRFSDCQNTYTEACSQGGGYPGALLETLQSSQLH